MTLARTFAGLFGAIATSLALSACGGATPESPDTTAAPVESQTSSDASSEASSDAPSDAAPEPNGSGALKVGAILLQGDTYYQNFQTALEKVVAEDGGSVTAALSNADPATENQVAMNMIQAQMDVILMQPAGDEASLETMRAIREAGITLICYGNCIGPTADPANVDGAIQSDNTSLGIGTAEIAIPFIEENFGDSVDIAVLNCDIASACKLRKSGFFDSLEEAGITVNVVTDQEGYLVDKATPVAADILTAHPDIDMIWASNDGGTAGAVIASRQAARDIPVFGTDISSQIAEFILEEGGNLQATTGQDAVGTAAGAYEMAKTVMAGGELEQFAVELPGVVYDRNNPETAQAYLDDNQ